MGGRAESLNVAVAAGVLLFEAARQRAAAGLKAPVRRGAADLVPQPRADRTPASARSIAASASSSLPVAA